MYKVVIVCIGLVAWLTGCGGSSEPERATSSAVVAKNPAAGLASEEGFTPLTLKDFAPFFGEGQTWREERDEIICSGSPKGYLHSLEKYGNFTWKGEFRFSDDVEIDPAAPKYPNTGFMLHILEPHQIWPRSLEVQGRFDQMGQIKSNGGIPDLIIKDQQHVREAARKPIGEWNSIEIISKDGAVTAILNGQQICHSEAGELKEGFIGLQSELFEVHFRHLRIRRDDAASPAPASAP